VNFERYGGRRFLLSVACLMVDSIMLLFGHVSDSIWRDVLIATVAVYIAGNVAQKKIDAGKAE